MSAFDVFPSAIQALRRRSVSSPLTCQYGGIRVTLWENLHLSTLKVCFRKLKHILNVHSLFKERWIASLAQFFFFLSNGRQLNLIPILVCQGDQKEKIYISLHNLSYKCGSQKDQIAWQHFKPKTFSELVKGNKNNAHFKYYWLTLTARVKLVCLFENNIYYYFVFERVLFTHKYTYFILKN